MDQQIRFCTTSDGVRIAYATVGEGPALVKAANWLTHLEFDWQAPCGGICSGHWQRTIPLFAMTGAGPAFLTDMWKRRR